MEEYGEMKMLYIPSLDLFVWTRKWNISEGSPYMVKMALDLGVQLAYSYIDDGSNAKVIGVTIRGASLFPIASAALNGVLTDWMVDGLSQTIATLSMEEHPEGSIVEADGDFPTIILPVNTDAIPAGLAQPM